MSVLRAHAGTFRWFRAAAFAAVAAAALTRMPFYPPAVMLAIVAGVGALGLLSPGIGVAGFVVAVGLPVLAANAVLGIALLVVGLAAVQYLGQDDARAFVLLGLVFLGTIAKLEWAIIALGGYVLAVSEGAVAAIVACAVLEVAAITLGAPVMGASVGGGQRAVLDLASAPEGALSFAWLLPALREMSPASVAASFRDAGPWPVLVLQPVLWAAGAGVSKAVSGGAPKTGPARLAVAAAAGAGGAAVIGIGSLGLRFLGSPVTSSAILTGMVGSAVVAALGAVALEALFPKIAPARKAPKTSVQAEDADVDELLRLIASAEEELASKHTVDETVMITDMKAFSAMTEEDGSVVSAKRIQRHRDLLLPVIAAHGGCGKSTGGDGLVASFPDPAEALAAAVEMQQTLDSFNGSHPGERAILIRIGLAHGEVVLDNGGRPFIGSGLNKAARVMNLADGGEILCSSDVVSRAGKRAPGGRSRGAFELKNIPGEVDVVEIGWEAEERRAAGA